MDEVEWTQAFVLELLLNRPEHINAIQALWASDLAGELYAPGRSVDEAVGVAIQRVSTATPEELADIATRLAIEEQRVKDDLATPRSGEADLDEGAKAAIDAFKTSKLLHLIKSSSYNPDKD